MQGRCAHRALAERVDQLLLLFDQRLLLIHLVLHRLHLGLHLALQAGEASFQSVICAEVAVRQRRGAHAVEQDESFDKKHGKGESIAIEEPSL